MIPGSHHAGTDQRGERDQSGRVRDDISSSSPVWLVRAILWLQFASGGDGDIAYCARDQTVLWRVPNLMPLDDPNRAPKCPKCGQPMIEVGRSWYWPADVDVFRCDPCGLFSSRPSKSVSMMASDDQDQPTRCPKCGQPMKLASTLPSENNLPSVEGYKCDSCNDTVVREIE
jgi:NAD-dependent SIR2 family protein deacetylase